MKRKHVLSILFISLILLLIGAQVRYRGLYKDIPVSQVLFAVTTFFLVRKRFLRGRWTHSLMPLCVLFWDVFGFFFDNIFSISHEWEFISIGTPNMLLCAVGSLYGSLLATPRFRMRILGMTLLITSAIFSGWYMVKGIDYWIHYCSAGNFTGRTGGKIVNNWRDIVNLPEANAVGPNDMVVLDFWSVSCPACFRKFPLLDSITRLHENKKQVIIRSVNLPLPDDTLKFERAREMAQKYTFQNIFADSIAWEKFDIRGVPTVVVVKNDEIIFKGDIKNLKDFLAEELQ